MDVENIALSKECQSSETTLNAAIYVNYLKQTVKMGAVNTLGIEVHGETHGNGLSYGLW